MRHKYTLAEILNLHTVIDLKGIAKDFGLKGYSKMKKEEIVGILSTHILEEENIEMKFGVATGRDIKLLENAINQEVVIQPSTYEYSYWQNIGFAFVTIQSEVQIPIEVEEKYLEVKKLDRYQKARLRNEKIDEYALACVNLYAVIELEKFIEIVNTYTALEVDEEEVISWCERRAAFKGCSMYFYQDGYLMSEIYGENTLGVEENYLDMLKQQSNKPYYLPSKIELLNYADDLYVDENKKYQEMLTFMTKKLGISKHDAYEYCVDIQWEIRNGTLPAAILDECGRAGISFPNDRVLNEFIKHLMEMFNHTRLAENRGHTPNEMGRMSHKNRAVLKQSQGLEGIPEGSNVVSFPMDRVSQPKVYPNDPCTCGSGKKYKKCCGKN